MVSNSRNRFILSATLGYLMLAMAWIFLSDQLLDLLADKQTILWLSTGKGVFFVLATTVILFFALRTVPARPVPAGIAIIDMLAEGFAPGRRPRWLMYSFAMLITLAMLWVRQSIATPHVDNPRLIFFMLPIILSALLGGLGPGLTATTVAALGVNYLGIPPLHSLRIDSIADRLQWSFLLLNGLAVSILSEVLRRSLTKLELNRQLLSSVVSGTSDAVFVKDLNGRYLLANAAAAAFVGKPLEQVIGADDRALFSPATAHDLMLKDRATLHSAQPQTHEEHLVTQQGDALVFLVTKGPVFDKNGNISGLFGISRDITQRQQAQEVLQASEAAMRNAQQLAHVGNWQWDVQTNLHTWSAEVFAIYGRDPSLPPAGYPEVQQYFSEQGWAQLTAAVELALSQGTPYSCDVQVLRPDGSHGWITARGQAAFDSNGQLLRLFGTVQDISERKLFIEHLQRNEERLQLALEASSAALWDWDVSTGSVYRSAYYYQLIGSTPEEDSHDFEFFQRTVHPDDLAAVLQHINAHRQGKTASIEFEYRLFNNTSDVHWMQVKGRAVTRDSTGTPLRIVGTLADISERKRIDDDFRFVLNEAGDAIWIADPQAHLLFANPAACKLTGHSLAELLELSISDLLDETYSAKLPTHLEQLQHEKFLRREWQLKRRDGSCVAVELTTEHMQDGRYMAFGRDLTEKKATEATLHARERQLARVIEGSNQGYWDWNLQTNDFQVSSRWEQMLGYTPGEMQVSPNNWPQLVQADDLSSALASVKRHLAGESPSHDVELRLRTKAGGWCWVHSQGRVVEWDNQDQPLMMSGTHTDITTRKKFELAQREATIFFDTSYEGIMLVDHDHRITTINPAFTRITGYTMADAVGKTPKFLSSGQHNAAFYRELWETVNQHDFWRGEIYNRRKNGEVYAELLSISVVRDATGAIQHYVGAFSDITLLKDHEAELERMAHYDALTGTPNRRLLADRLAQSIVRSIRTEKTLAVCFLDLDGFKAINDQYGHAAGDRLLIGVTENLKQVLRAEDTLARLGGDEFIVLLSDIASPEECSTILDRVLNAVSEPIQIDAAVLQVSASIGVSLYPDDNADADTLLRHADQAMYQAKEAGKNRFHLFDPESDRKAQMHRQYLEQLREALAKQQFVLYYQPKVDLFSGAIVGVEALLRWLQPGNVLVPPSEFLPHIYGSTLEKPLGEWVIRAALQQASEWHQRGLLLTVSVNVSADHLMQADFFNYLQDSLAQHPDFPADHFELEVLETAAIEDMEQAVKILRHCRSLGVHFALDDFGTGYSSLTYLRKLPVDTIKIDQSFVRDMLTDPEDLGIVEGVVRLASFFNRHVIAEGVETLEHGVMLRQLGCRLAQGYGIAKPMPAEHLFDWAEQWRKAPRI